MYPLIVLVTDAFTAARHAARSLATRPGTGARVLYGFARRPAVSSGADAIQGGPRACGGPRRADGKLPGVRQMAGLADVSCEIEYRLDRPPLAVIAGAATKPHCDFIAMDVRPPGRTPAEDVARKVTRHRDALTRVCR
jgi:hypothetical protein